MDGRVMKAPSSNEKRLRLFGNAWLEKLTIISLRWFVVIWSCALAWLAFSAWGSTALSVVFPLVIAGWLMFTGLEYLTHRFLFHSTPKSALAKHIVFLMHGNHHIDSTDKLRCLMPPIVSFPIGLAVSGLMEALAPAYSGWMIFGFVLGYVVYDLTHYATHQMPMKGKLGQGVKRHHMRHHFAAQDGNYAVTALFWDRLFNTTIQLRKLNKVPSASHQKENEPAE